MADGSNDESGEYGRRARSLERFLVWSFRGTLVAFATMLGIFFVYPMPVSLGIAAVVAVDVGLIYSAIGLARAGEFDRATQRFAISAWMVAAADGLLVPSLYPITLLLACVPLAIVIPYASRPVQIRSFVVCLSLAVLIISATFFPPLIPMDSVPEVLPRATNLAFVSILGGLFCLSIWDSFEQVRDSNRGLRRAYSALRESEIRLEHRVAERTVALERSHVELASARDEAVSANEAKSRFLASVSHDLRQPVNALRLFAEALSEGTGEPRNREIAEHIRASAELLTGMFDELLDLSRLESGSVAVRLIDFPLGPLVLQLVAELEPEALRKGIELQFVPTSANVRSDPILLRRILQNLVVNALRHTDHGRVLIGCRRRAGSLRVEVWDTGPGIPEEFRGEVFREFVQLDRGKRSEGIGLGLAIVERLSQLLGCRVELDSRIGWGSVFRVVVPLATKGSEARAPSSEDAGRARIGGLHVLAIDDDFQVLASLRFLLESWGCSLVLARSSDEAVESLERTGWTPDVIVADYALADGETGLSAIDAIRRAKSRRVPALVITGESDPAILARIGEAGHVHLLKPIRPAQLRAALSAQIAEGGEAAVGEPGGTPIIPPDRERNHA